MIGQSTGKSLSALIGRMIPSFVQEDHKNFTLFLQKYFEYLEQDGKVYDLLSNAMLYADIDETVDSFIEHFRKQYSNDIPRKFSFLTTSQDINGDIRLIIKKIRDYYLTKGSETAYEFIFRVIYGVDITFYYPKVDILRCSDGKWYVPYYVVPTITPNAGVWFDVFIQGRTSKAKAYLDNITKVQYPINSGLQRDTLTLTDVVGSFVAGEVIEIVGNTTEVLTIDGIILGEGRWTNTDGFLSYDKYIQDNDYYQEYSYEIQSPLPSEVYKKLITDIVHPAGLKLFGKLIIFNVVVMPKQQHNEQWNVEWEVNAPLPTNTVSPYHNLSFGGIKSNLLPNTTWLSAESDIMSSTGYYGNMVLSDLSFMTTNMIEANKNENCSIVSVNGTKITGYTLLNNDIVLPSTYNLGDELHIFSLGYKTEQRELFTGDGSTTTFTLNGTIDIHGLLVFVNGIKQRTTLDVYSNGSNLVFVNAPANSSTIEIYKYQKHSSQVTLSGDGSTISFNLQIKPYVDSKECVMVFVNGLFSNINITNNTLSIIPAPTSGTDNIEIVYLNRLTESQDIIKLDGIKTTYRYTDTVNPFKYQIGSTHKII